jgi:glycosyltransferase involved in cell wall biosynthesis
VKAIGRRSRAYVLSEAWAAGYPVVALDIGAPAERIRAEGGGLLLPFASADRHAPSGARSPADASIAAS